jgi:hypothetical protein
LVVAALEAVADGLAAVLLAAVAEDLFAVAADAVGVAWLVVTAATTTAAVMDTPSTATIIHFIVFLLNNAS